MTVKHTPGPWYATREHIQSASINEDNYVCVIQANARLIAAAPELLEACKVAADNIENGYPLEAGAVLETLQNAITKATT